jgi:hypothetical protein
MTLYLEGKTPLDANDLSPKEATHMSRDIKYIGMDVHKEATVIAVLNGSGKLVMESLSRLLWLSIPYASVSKSSHRAVPAHKRSTISHK